jgi:hypothetical protein
MVILNISVLMKSVQFIEWPKMWLKSTPKMLKSQTSQSGSHEQFLHLRIWQLFTIDSVHKLYTNN